MEANLEAKTKQISKLLSEMDDYRNETKEAKLRTEELLQKHQVRISLILFLKK